MIYETNSEAGLATLVKRHWRLMALTSGIVLSAGIAALSLMPKSYQSTAKLLVMRTEQRLGGLGLLHNSLPELGGTSQPLYTQVEMLRLLPSIKRVVAQLELKDAHGQLLSTDEVARRLRVTPLKGTDLIEVSFRDRDPRVAQRVVAALCEVYLEQTESTRRDGVQAGLKIVDEQLASARTRLDEAEVRLTEFKQSSGRVSLSQEIQTSVHDLSQLDSLIRNSKLHLASQEAKALSLKAKLRLSPQEALEAAALSQNPRLRALQEQLMTAETSPLLTQGLAPDHPELQALEERIAMLKREMDAEMGHLPAGKRSYRPLDEVQVGLLRDLTSTEAEIKATQASLAQAEQSRSSLNAQMASLPGHEVMLERLQREVAVAGQIYQDLLQKREQARQNLSIAPSYAQVVQPPDAPERPLIPLGGQAGTVLVLASLAAGFGAGSFRDLLDRRVSPNSLAISLPKLPIFFNLPMLSKAETRDGELILQSLSSPAYVQAVQTLGIALENHLAGPAGQVLSMTSSNSGEGKSMTLANLALGLSGMGHRVLLVDADFRRPRLHALFGSETPGAGLSEALLDRIAPQEAIQRLESLHLVSSGSAKVSFLQGKLKTRLGALLAAWRLEYDFILIDLPPLSMIAEVAQVGRHSDGMLYLSNFHKAPAETLLAGAQLMQSVGMPILGVVSISATPMPQDSAYYLLASGGGQG